MQVGYMSVPYQNVDMTSHAQYMQVRNGRGQVMLDAVEHRLQVWALHMDYVSVCQTSK